MNTNFELPEGMTDSRTPVPVSAALPPSLDYRESMPGYEDGADLRDYLDVVLRRKWLVITVLLAVFMATLVLSLTMKPVFVAQGRLELSPSAPKVTKFQELSASDRYYVDTREFVQTQVKLLTSESLARRVVERLHLEQNPVFNPAAAVSSSDGAEEPGLLDSLKDTLGQWKSAVKSTVRELLPWKRAATPVDASLDRLKFEEGLVGKVSGSLSVAPERDTTIVGLTFSSTDPATARDVVNGFIREFIGWQMDKKIDAASAAKQQLDKQLEIVRVQLEKAEANLNAFAQKAGIVSLDSNLNLIYRQLEEINSALATMEAERISKEALYKQALKGDISTMPSVIGNAMVLKLREQYNSAMAEYQELYSTFKDDYPKLKNLKAKMADIEKRITNEEARILDSLKNDYLTALSKETALREDADKKKALALELNDRATQYKILQREVETNKTIHQSLLERAKEIDANVGTELANIQVVDYASLPLAPAKPNVRRNLLIALVVGLMGGIGLAFFLEYLDNTIKRVDEVSDRFQIPVLGILPLADPDEIKDLDSLVRLKPKSAFAETIRTAKVSIQLSSHMDRPAKSLLITSTSAEEGKSTIAANLSQAFASSDEKVIVIDADLRKPRLYRIFNSNGNRKGLSQFLSGMCKAEEIIQKTETPNLYFVAAGPVPPNPAELLTSSRMRAFLELLGNHFDRIVIDSPPATGFADVLVLGNHVDGVILVATLGQTHREALRIFRRSILNVRGNLLGCLINKLDIGRRYGGYHYNYYRYYHSYYHPKYAEAPESLPAVTREQEEGREA